MAHLPFLVGLVVAAAACGGRFSSDQAVDGSGGSGAGGTGGSVGTGGGVAGAGGAAGGAGGQGGSDWGACLPTDWCVLEPVNVCELGCNPALSQFVAVNGARVSDYDVSHPQPRCTLPPLMCPASPPGALDEPNFMALCVDGHCEAIDVRTSALSQCKTNTDCYARSGTSCCPSCGDPVAFSYTGTPPQVFCARGPEACPAIACVGLPYAAIPYCNASGHCALEYAAPGAAAGGGYP